MLIIVIFMAGSLETHSLPLTLYVNLERYEVIFVFWFDISGDGNYPNFVGLRSLGENWLDFAVGVQSGETVNCC